ncbi:MAG: PIN domain-containing protein [Proteobacteria bacterium]|nr:PIN domain-containing protein [Pseudomonadota bacterium]
MAANPIVDTSFLVALFKQRDRHHRWAVQQAARFDPPWHTCESVLSETFYLVGTAGTDVLAQLFERNVLKISLDLSQHQGAVMALMNKYRKVPMSIADGCLVRLTEILPDPVLLTADSDFRIYRRHGRQMIPCIMPT